MPNVCAVHQCHNTYRGKNSPFRFFHIPSVKTKEGDATRELSERRRRAWIAAINRQDISFERVKDYHRICGKHFVSGQPAYLHHDTDVDWVPTLDMGNREEATDFKRKRHEQAAIIKSKKLKLEAASTLLELHTQQIEGEEEKKEEEEMAEGGSILPKDKKRHSRRTETLAIASTAKKMSDELNKMTDEINSFEHKVPSLQFIEDDFKENDENVKYYTGLPCWFVLHSFVSFLKPHLKSSSNSSLSQFQKVLLVLMKLRLNLSHNALEDMFGIHVSTVTDIFLKTLNIMYPSLKWMLNWPDRESVMNTMPLCFIGRFDRNVRVIVEFFDILIEKTSQAKARTKSTLCSNDKDRDSIKYLSGLTPQGTICFLSSGWDVEVSGIHIVENCSFLSNLETGSIVLADRGFTVSKSTGLRSAEVVVPEFKTRGRKQLTAFEAEPVTSNKMARIHVGKVTGVIGNMQTKYSILSSVIPADYLRCADGDQLTLLDKIVHVCACLTNLNPSVVPFP